MIPAFSHNITNSFFLWFDNHLMRKAQAFQTYTTKLYNYTDARLGDNKVVYGSPYKQWAYDNSVSGISIPSGFLINTLNPSVFLFWFAWTAAIGTSAAETNNPIGYKLIVFGTCLGFLLLSDLL